MSVIGSLLIRMTMQGSESTLVNSPSPSSPSPTVHWLQFARAHQNWIVED